MADEFAFDNGYGEELTSALYFLRELGAGQKLRLRDRLRATKKKNGCFMGTYSPYGYQKSSDNKYQLVIYPVASIVGQFRQQRFQKVKKKRNIQICGRIKFSNREIRGNREKERNDKYNKRAF